MGKVRWQDLDEYDRAENQKFKRQRKNLDDDIAVESTVNNKRLKKVKRK
jgi:hypothetical protein